MILLDKIILLSLSGMVALLQCDAVDKRHAVITFDFHFSRFKVKDLSTRNGVSFWYLFLVSSLPLLIIRFCY